MRTALVIEDHTLVRAVVGRALENAGHLTQYARTFEDAQRWLASGERFDVVYICSGVLDDAGGLAQLEVLIAAAGDAKVVIACNLCDVSQVSAARSAGGIVLAKPFTPHDLLHALSLPEHHA